MKHTVDAIGKQCPVPVVMTKKVLDAASREMLADIKKIFNRTKQIEGVHTVNIYENVTPRPNRHDLMIEMEMDPEALSVYDASADHQEWKAKYGKYIQTKTIFDYE